MTKKRKVQTSTAEPKSQPVPKKSKKAPASSTTTASEKGVTPYGKAKKEFVAKPLPKKNGSHFVGG